MLCVKCGYLGYTTKECVEASLPAWEQSYLKEIVFGDPPRSSFAAAGYGEFDGQSRPYGRRSSSSTGVYGGSVSDAEFLAAPQLISTTSNPTTHTSLSSYVASPAPRFLESLLLFFEFFLMLEQQAPPVYTNSNISFVLYSRLIRSVLPFSIPEDSAKIGHCGRFFHYTR